MPCRDMEYLISSYLDHELSPDESSQVKQHLQQCPFCRQVYEDLLETCSLIRSLPDVPIPAGFQEQLHEKLAQVNQGTTRKETVTFRDNLFTRLFQSYRWATLALVIVLFFVAYSFTVFQKNMPATDEAPAVMNAEIAMEQAENAPAQDQMTILQDSENSDQKNSYQENRSDIEKPKSQLVLLLVLATAVILFAVKKFFKFARKH